MTLEVETPLNEIPVTAATEPGVPPVALQTDHVPLVSIGLAVYNGEKYLREAIDSILAQTFIDYELIISDNASTDSTAEICQEYAARDPRIRYHRNATNIGGANNENQTFRMSRGKYFRWAAHDDVLAPTLLERCAEVMEANPDVVLCYPWSVVIDGEGTQLEVTRPQRPATLQGRKLFAHLSRSGHQCEETYGLMRSEALAATGLQRNYTDSDRTLLAHMALLGRYYEIPVELFFKRQHPGNSVNAFPDWRQRMQWFGISTKSAILMPHWQQLLHYLAIVRTAPVGRAQRIQYWMEMGPWLVTNRKWRSLLKDVAIASLQLVRRRH